MNEDKVVPNIRFKGFEDEWKSYLLGKIAVFINGRAFKQNELLDKGKYPVLRVGNFYTNDKWFYSDLKLPEKLYANKGDLLYTWSATFGPHLWKGDKVIYHYHIWKIIFSSEVSKQFALQMLLNDKEELMNNTNGSTMIHLTKNEMEKKLVKIPIKQEQQNIGNFFSKLDKLLDLQQQKIDKLELLKKALLQKLFPKHDSKVPELRFKGYDQEWEEKKFSSLYKKCNEKNNLSFGSNKIISVANMYYKKDNVKSDDNYMRTYNIFRLGDIAFEGNKSKKFTFGRFVENTIGDGIVSHVFEVFRPISNGDITYWKYAIHNEDFIAPVLMKSTVKATMMNNLIAKDFLKQQVPVPQLSEQQKIGNLLSKVDQLIELENRKLQNFQQVKKCLLQNMFVD